MLPLSGSTFSFPRLRNFQDIISWGHFFPSKSAHIPSKDLLVVLWGLFLLLHWLSDLGILGVSPSFGGSLRSWHVRCVIQMLCFLVRAESKCFFQFYDTMRFMKASQLFLSWCVFLICPMCQSCLSIFWISHQSALHVAVCSVHSSEWKKSKVSILASWVAWSVFEKLWLERLMTQVNKSWKIMIKITYT